MRRTCIGQTGAPPAAALDAASRIMAAELGWDEARRLSEIGSLASRFQTREAA